MTGADDMTMPLPGGLDAGRTAALADLVAQIAGAAPLQSLPYLAPALLFANASVQDRLDMPHAAADQILVQEYQGITCLCAVIPGADLVATASAQHKASGAAYRFALADRDGNGIAQLDTALRLFPADDLAAVKPMRLRPDMLGDADWSDEISVPQSAIDTYLALSGDGNPIHSDARQAAALGLAAPVVPGLFLISMIQPICEAALPGTALASLKARFLAPLCADQAFRIALQQRGRAAGTDHHKLRAYAIGSDDRVLAIADLQVQS